MYDIRSVSRTTGLLKCQIVQSRRSIGTTLLGSAPPLTPPRGAILNQQQTRSIRICILSSIWTLSPHLTLAVSQSEVEKKKKINVVGRIAKGLSLPDRPSLLAALLIRISHNQACEPSAIG